MVGYLSGLGLVGLGYLPGQVPTSTNTLDFNALDKEFKSLYTNEAKHGLLKRLCGSDTNISIPQITKDSRDASIAVFHQLRGILENGDINLDPNTKLRALRFMQMFSESIGQYLKEESPLQEIRLSFDFAAEVLEGSEKSLKKIAQIPKLTRNGNALVLPDGIFTGLPFADIPEGINFNFQSPKLQLFVQKSLINSLKSVPENIEIVAPKVTEQNLESATNDFNRLQSCVTQMGKRFELPIEDRAVYARLLSLCTSYAKNLQTYHKSNDNESDSYGELAAKFAKRRTQELRTIEESFPPTGPESKDPNHKLTSLRNKLNRLQISLEKAKTNEEKNKIKEDFLNALLERNEPIAPESEDIYHRRTATEVFYELRSLIDDPKINIPVHVRAKGFKFLFQYARSISNYMDYQAEQDMGNQRPRDSEDPSAVLFSNFAQVYRNLPNTIEALDNITRNAKCKRPHQDLHLMLKPDTLSGLPYRFTGAEAKVTESPQLKAITEDMLTKATIAAEDNGNLLIAPEIKNKEQLYSATCEFESLSRLAYEMTFRNNNSPESLRVIPQIWRLCGSYALAIQTYHKTSADKADSKDLSSQAFHRGKANYYAQVSEYYLANAFLTRQVTNGAISKNDSKLPTIEISPEVSLLDHLGEKAMTPELKKDLLQKLFCGGNIVLIPPTQSDSYDGLFAQRAFNKIKEISEDPSLDVDLETRIKGFRFLSGYAKNLAQTFPEGSGDKNLYMNYSTAYLQVAGTLEKARSLFEDVNKIESAELKKLVTTALAKQIHLMGPTVEPFKTPSTPIPPLVKAIPMVPPPKLTEPEEMPMVLPPKKIEPEEKPVPMMPPLPNPMKPNPPEEKPIPMPPPMQEVMKPTPMPPPMQEVVKPIQLPKPAPVENEQITITLSDKRMIQISNLISGLPPQSQANIYSKIIKLNSKQLIPEENLTFTGNGIKYVQAVNDNLNITNIQGIYCVYRRKNNDDTYTYTIAIYKDYSGKISLGNKQLFPDN